MKKKKITNNIYSKEKHTCLIISSKYKSKKQRSAKQYFYSTNLDKFNEVYFKRTTTWKNCFVKNFQHISNYKIWWTGEIINEANHVDVMRDEGKPNESFCGWTLFNKRALASKLVNWCDEEIS